MQVNQTSWPTGSMRFRPCIASQKSSVAGEKLEDVIWTLESEVEPLLIWCVLLPVARKAGDRCRWKMSFTDAGTGLTNSSSRKEVNLQ